MERTQGRQRALLLGDRPAAATLEPNLVGHAPSHSVTATTTAEIAGVAPETVGRVSQTIEVLFAQAVRELGDARYSRAYRVSKRVVDVVVAALGLLLVSPLFLLVALAIRLDSPGPAFFVQPRVGQRGRLFAMLKFRTMVHGAALPRVGPHKRPDDQRVTRVGRLLRRTSLDELPQLVNVLLGQMSLVGPRPELPAIVLAHYAPWQYRRLLVPQGITGWWQVTGRSAKLLHEHTEDDLYYVAHAGLGLDLRILARTVRAVVRRDGAF